MVSSFVVVIVNDYEYRKKNYVCLFFSSIFDFGKKLPAIARFFKINGWYQNFPMFRLLDFKAYYKRIISHTIMKYDILICFL